MSRKLTALNVLILLAMLFIVAYGQTSKRVTTPEKQAELNKLGSEGWELVAVQNAGLVTAFYLKRQK
jgi:hypothetical protein